MEVSQRAIARMLLYSLVLGGLWGVFYDVLGTIRALLEGRHSPRGSAILTRIRPPFAFRRLEPRATDKPRPTAGVFLFFSDACFCLIGAVAVLLLLYATNSGQFRASAVCLLLLGFCLYRFLAPRLVFGILDVGVCLAIGVFTWVFALPAYPVARLTLYLWGLLRPWFGRVKRYVLGKIKGIRSRRARLRPDMDTGASPKKMTQNGKYYFSRGGGTSPKNINT